MMQERSRAHPAPRHEAVWLRLLLHRPPAAQRYAQSAEIPAILQESIQEIENRLDKPE